MCAKSINDVHTSSFSKIFIKCVLLFRAYSHESLFFFDRSCLPLDPKPWTSSWPRSSSTPVQDLPALPRTVAKCGGSTRRGTVIVQFWLMRKVFFSRRRKKKQIESVLCNYLYGMIVIVNDSYDTSRGWLSTARRWCLVGDGSFPAETRHRRWSTLPSSDATSDACSTSATAARGTRVPGVALFPVAGRLSFHVDKLD